MRVDRHLLQFSGSTLLIDSKDHGSVHCMNLRFSIFVCYFHLNLVQFAYFLGQFSSPFKIVSLIRPLDDAHDPKPQFRTTSQFSQILSV